MKNFSFMKYRLIYFALSLIVIIPGLISLAVNGVKLSIDFTGGSLLELHDEQKSPPMKIDRPTLQSYIGSTPEIIAVQTSGDQQFLIRSKALSNQEKDQLLLKLTPAFQRLTEVRFESVGPTLGKELMIKTLMAVVAVSVFITLYIGRQFHSVKYGLAAVMAMFHDMLVLIGMFSLLGRFFNAEVDVLFVTALLTTLSFSVHDTIVVFDRIRENVRKHPQSEFMTVVDASVLETLGRSVNNSMTIIIMLSALVLLGGDTVRLFSIALLIGAVTGTYSSTFTAAPLVVLWDSLEKSRKKKK